MAKKKAGANKPTTTVKTKPKRRVTRPPTQRQQVQPQAVGVPPQLQEMLGVPAPGGMPPGAPAPIAEPMPERAPTRKPPARKKKSKETSRGKAKGK